jgi:hypothetical protein
MNSGICIKHRHSGTAQHAGNRAFAHTHASGQAQYFHT